MSVERHRLVRRRLDLLRLDFRHHLQHAPHQEDDRPEEHDHHAPAPSRAPSSGCSARCGAARHVCVTRARRELSAPPMRARERLVRDGHLPAAETRRSSAAGIHDPWHPLTMRLEALCATARACSHPSTRRARSRKNSAANARSRTSIRSSAPWISGAVSQQRLVALGEEPVGHALRKRGAEVARVGEPGQDRRRRLRAGIALGDPLRDRVHQRRGHRRAVADDALGELDPKRRRSVRRVAPSLPRSRAWTVSLAEAREARGSRPQHGPAGDHVDLLRRADQGRRERDAEHRLEHRRQTLVGRAQPRDRARGIVGVLADRLQERARLGRQLIGRAGARPGAPAAAPSSAARCRPCSASTRAPPRPRS